MHDQLSLALLPLLAALSSPASACPPEGRSLESLMALPGKAFAVESDEERNLLARQLVACVGHPDPALRDGVVYSAYAAWLRGDGLSDDTVLYLLGSLSGLLTAEDSDGFTRPFAALDLAEVARTDRIVPRFTLQQRQQLVDDAVAYLEGVRDYRGYSDREGWRHGVAHGADLALQLVLNSEISPEQVNQLLDAIASQVAPPGEVFYVFGEGERLARPVYYAYLRQDLGPETWDTWFTALADPAPLADWSEVWNSRAGLARRHNLQGFVQALYVMADTGESAAAVALGDRVLEVMRKL